MKSFDIKKAKVLFIDDDEDILFIAKHLLKSEVSNIETLAHPSQLGNQAESFDIIYLDMNYELEKTCGTEGFEWLNSITKQFPDSAIVMMTSHGTIDLAVKSIHEGAMDFIIKPLTRERLIASIHNAMRFKRSNQEIQQLDSKNHQIISEFQNTNSPLVGKSPTMRKLVLDIQKVSQTNAHVLILGENGTGKELVARMIHQLSQRKDEIFITVDLGSLNENLFESEMYGYKKGAFTDAKEDRIGRFELSSEGTLFLDEIGNLPLHLQSKLLKALQEKVIYRVGSHDPIKIDSRIISATNMPLYKMVENNEFREDLLFRINTVELNIPALRDRTEDIPLLVEHYLPIYARRHQTNVQGISNQALEYLMYYAWPGNIRELEHAIERAVIMAGNHELSENDFLFIEERNKEKDELSHPSNLNESEKMLIQQSLKKSHNNISRAAARLGISRYALYRKIKKYSITT